MQPLGAKMGLDQKQVSLDFRTTNINGKDGQMRFVGKAGCLPSKHSQLCSEHFEDSAFVLSPTLCSSIRHSPKTYRLKDDAVPTIFTYEEAASGGDEISSKP